MHVYMAHPGGTAVLESGMAVPDCFSSRLLQFDSGMAMLESGTAVPDLNVFFFAFFAKQRHMGMQQSISHIHSHKTN